jgi:hypothetical protein
MKRLIVITAALLTLAGLSVATATAGSASVCEPDGLGCTPAGTYPGPNAVINSDYGSGFDVVWTESVVQPYSSGVPLYWTAYVTYTNNSASDLTLDCPSDTASVIAEHMSGGSGDDGTVYSDTSNCTEDPGYTATVPPGGSVTDWATFHNVPWPGSAVSITWGDIGTSGYVYPFPASSPPPPAPAPPPPPSPPSHPAYHSVTLFGLVTCRGAGKEPLDVGRVRIQAANGEAHDAKLHLAWTVYATTYSVTFTRVPPGGERAYVYVTCGFYDYGHLNGTVYGLRGPVHLKGFFGYQPFSIYPGEKP